MKDYSLNLEERKDFIRNYKIKNKEIIVKPAKGKKYKVPYTEEREQEILNQMESQIVNADANNFFERMKNKFAKNVLATFACLIAALIAIIVLTFAQLTAIPFLIFDATFVSFLIGVLVHKFKENLAVEYGHDFMKNKFILENKDELNDKIENDPQLKEIISKKMREQIEKSPETKKIFDVNYSDKISSKDYRALKNYLLDSEEEKPLVRTRKI